MKYKSVIMKSAKNLHTNRVQQALIDSTNARDLAYGKVAHKVLDRLGSVRQMKLPVRLILKPKKELVTEDWLANKGSYLVGAYLGHRAYTVRFRAVGERKKMLTLANIWKVAVEISQVGREKVEITPCWLQYPH